MFNSPLELACKEAFFALHPEMQDALSKPGSQEANKVLARLVGYRDGVFFALKDSLPGRVLGKPEGGNTKISQEYETGYKEGNTEFKEQTERHEKRTNSTPLVKAYVFERFGR